MARALSGDLDGSDASFQDSVSIGEQVGAPEVLPVALSQRALVAMARGDWDQAGLFAGRATAALRRAGIELARVHRALADLTGARTLLREIDELLRRRPGLGTLAGEAQALRAQLAQRHGSSAPGGLSADRSRAAPAAAAVHPTCGSPRSAPNCSCPGTPSNRRRRSVYRKLGASTRSQAVTRARELGLLDR